MRHEMLLNKKKSQVKSPLQEWAGKNVVNNTLTNSVVAFAIFVNAIVIGT